MKKINSKALPIIGLVSAIIIGMLGWVLNMGFNRFIFTIFGIPIVMLALLIAVDLISRKYFEYSRLLIAANILFNISYVGSHVFLPDGMLDSPKGEGPASESYMLFNLIHDSDLYEAFMVITLAFFACFVLSMLFQIVWMIILKRRIKVQIANKAGE